VFDVWRGAAAQGSDPAGGKRGAKQQQTPCGSSLGRRTTSCTAMFLFVFFQMRTAVANMMSGLYFGFYGGEAVGSEN